MIFTKKVTEAKNTPVESVRWDGKRCRLHYEDGREVWEGDVVFSKGKYFIQGGYAPHKPSSTGRVHVKMENGGTREMFPTVFNMKWKEVKMKKDENLSCGSYHCKGGHKLIIDKQGREKMNFIPCGATKAPRCQPWGTCVDNPFRTVNDLEQCLEKGEEIELSVFLTMCEVSPELERSMRDFPRDYRFEVSYYGGERIFYFTWSAIEHFYKSN